MVGFGDASQWMKLALIFSALCLLLHLAAIDTPGWADDPGVKCGSNASCGREWYAGTEACEVSESSSLLDKKTGIYSESET